VSRCLGVCTHCDPIMWLVGGMPSLRREMELAFVLFMLVSSWTAFEQ
jgi:hypothetical protein